MLRVKAFKISDDTGINDLLAVYPMAAGAHILISDGQVLIPYEDGQVETNAIRIARIGEHKNTMIREREIIEHSQGVMDVLIADAKERVQVAETELKTAEESADKKKYNAEVKEGLRNKLKEVKDAERQVMQQSRSNAHEIIRLNTNLEKFDVQIAALSA